MKTINVLIPMAGLGSRFADKGYEKPKPLIDVNGKPMIKAVLDSLNFDSLKPFDINVNYIFIVQKAHSVKYHLLDMLDEYAPGSHVIELEGLTDGAAITTLAAKEFINNDNLLIIANSDQIIKWDTLVFTGLLNLAFIDGVTATFQARDAKWSYVKTDWADVTQVAEKDPISDRANAGIYGWSKGSDYVKYAEQMIAKNIKTNNEFYIAPVYNEAIADGKKITFYDIAEMHGVGTPEDLEAYLEKNSTQG